MSFYVSLAGFTPGARYDGTPWVSARIEEAVTASGPWSPVETIVLPVEDDPTDPAPVSVSSGDATLETGWFRLVFIDAQPAEQSSPAIYWSPLLTAVTGQTMGQLATRLIDLAGFDVDQEEALEWLNDRHQTMVARSRMWKETVSLGTTDGVSQSYVAPQVVELYELRVAGRAASRVARASLEGLRASEASISYPGLAFAPMADAGANSTFEIYPLPAADLELEVFAAMRPPDLTLTDRPIVPREFHRALVEGAVASGLSFDTEQIGPADRFEQRFDNACAELGQAVRRQYRGRGPAQIRVMGLNA